MIVRTRILEESILLPGYFRVRIVDLTEEGQLVTITDSVSSRVDLQTLLARLDMRSPRWDIHDNCVIVPMRQKLTAIAKCGQTKDRERANEISEAVEMIIRDAASDDTWAYKLWIQSDKGSEDSHTIHDWDQLQTSEALGLLLAGARAGKLPGIMRVKC